MSPEDLVKKHVCGLRLRDMSLLALDYFNKNLSFTNEMVNAYLELVKDVFGENEASGVLNLVVDTMRKYDCKITFNDALVEAIAMHVGKKEVDQK